MATKNPAKRKAALRQTTMDADAIPATKTARKGVTFIDSHRMQYGLSIGSINTKTKNVGTVVCRFCVGFGREEAQFVLDSSKKPRKRTVKPKLFTSFRTDLWAEYNEAIADNAKEVFFDAPSVPYVETIKAAFESEACLRFQVRASIVEEIMGKLLFHPDELGGISHTRALAIFTPCNDPTQGQYQVVEANPSRFRLCVRFLGHGATFRMAAALMDDTKEETGIGRFQGCTELVAARYARIVCAVSLECLAQMMQSAWGLSIALDCATHQGKSYVNIRARFPTVGMLHSYHLLAIPLHERHTTDNIYAVVERFLDALVPEWRDQLVGVSTDGAANMVGRVTGLATQIEQATTNPITRVWCGLHQLDLKMQIIFEQALNSTYLTKLHGLIGYLRRQYKLISEMGTKCPKVANTLWLSMYGVANWLCTNGFEVRQHLTAVMPPCDPNAMWWIFLFALREIAKEANAVFVSLQGLSTMVNQQQDRFGGLVQKICTTTSARGPLSTDDLEQMPSETHEKCGNFAIAHSDAENWLQDIDLYVCGQLQVLDDNQKKIVIEAVARLAVVACDNIHSPLEADFEAIPVSPKDLVATPMPAFYAVVERHRVQVARRLGEAAIDRIGREFKELKDRYKTAKAFRVALDAFDHRLASFDAMWAIDKAAERFPTLALFCGGVASVFPNTATVESDFSLILCEKDDQRITLTDISLEGVLHCKQWQRLRQVLNDI